MTKRSNLVWTHREQNPDSEQLSFHLAPNIVHAPAHKGMVRAMRFLYNRSQEAVRNSPRMPNPAAPNSTNHTNIAIDLRPIKRVRERRAGSPLWYQQPPKR